MANKTLQLKRQGGFASVSAATQALETAFANGGFAAGEPVLAILTNGSVVLGIQGDATHGSVFYNAATIEEAIAQAKADLIGDATHYLTLGALEDAIDEISGNTASYTITKTTTGLPEEVKERYNLTKTVGSTTENIGANIDIYKDSSIVSIDYDADTQELVYTYVNASGSTVETRIDLSELVIEAEAQSGITATNHILHGVVDPASESFLTVGANGFKVSGVQDAIDAKVNALDAEESGSTTHVSVKVTEADGVITDVTVTENDIASNTDLQNEIGYRKAVTGIDANAYTPNAGTNYISGSTITSLNAADIALDTQVKANADAIAALENAKVSVVKGDGSEAFLDIAVNGDETVYTVTVSGITAAITSAIEALDTEDTAVANQFVTAVSQADGTLTISRAQVAASGVTANAITGDTFEVTGTTVQAQMEEVVAEISDMQEGAYSGVTSANAAINAGAVTDNGQVLTFQLDTTTANSITSDMLEITSNGLNMKNTFDMGEWS